LCYLQSFQRRRFFFYLVDRYTFGCWMFFWDTHQVWLMRAGIWNWEFAL
jgi:hypothetical protein